MARLRYQGRELELAPGETVLEGLQRGGLRVPSSCRVGACQTCLMQARSGSPGAAAQVGLRPTQKEEGWFLACQSRPEQDLEIGERVVPTTAARIMEVDPLGPALVRVRLRSEEPMSFRPGQFVHLQRPDGLIRAYSLANLPGEDLEFHVRVHPQGHMSRWLAAALPGQDVR
ncbi:MAG TPA: 2Fe-2S iron-sulfur cluster-binding protein, partial [Myxococcota bacterium]|nr:2Fe-2S iron-sulfur cluster-binding protein [Myxococcota bacterium]